MSKKLAGGRYSYDRRLGRTSSITQMRTVEITDDSTAKAAYITLIPHDTVYKTKTASLSGIDVLFDIDRGNNILGIEILY